MKIRLFEQLSDEDVTNWSEANEVYYTKFLDQFEREVYPMFRRFGYTRDTALNMMMQIETNSILNRISEQLEDRNSV